MNLATAVQLRRIVSLDGGFYQVMDAVRPLFLLVMGAKLLDTLPLGNAFSRWSERSAYALMATGKGRSYASALTCLAN